jgi:hypothetical protein
MEKLKSFWSSHKVKIIVAISFSLLFVIIFSRLNRNTLAPNDDTFFQEVVPQFSTLWDYLSFRLLNWTSRILSETFIYIFSPLSVNYWRLTSLVVYILSVWIGYKVYKLSSLKLNDKKDGAILAVIMGGLLLMGLNVLGDYNHLGAVYWFTGSMNYFWLTPLFLGALYAPLYIVLSNKLPKKLWLILSLAAGLLTVISHEQFGVALLVILFGLAIYHAIKNKKLDKTQVWLSVFALLAIVGFAVYFLVPGNANRLELETATWQPDMYSVPLFMRLESDIRWFMDALLNQTGYLLPIIWILLAVLLLKNSKKVINVVVAVCLSAAAVSGLFADKFMVITVFLREFYPVWGFTGSAKDWLPIIIHVMILALTIAAAWLVFKNQRGKAIATTVLMVSAAGTVAAICLSPTMYASQYRTLYVASVLLVITIVILLNQVLNNSKSQRSFR